MSSYKPLRVRKSAELKFIADAETVFPLLCPVREMEWIEWWEYEMLYSESGLIEEGCIFRTRKAYNLGDRDLDMLWTVIMRDEKSYKLEFLNVATGVMVMRFNIHLKPAPDGTCGASIEYIFTSLSEEGNRHIEGLTDSNFERFPSGFQEIMNYYLKHGTKMKRERP